MLRWRVAQAAEIRWWKRYLRRRNPQEYLAWKRAYWLDFLQKLGFDKLPDGAFCLDAGSSLAGIFMVLQRQTVVALDPLMEAYKRDLSAFFEPKNYPQVQEFRAQEIEKMQEEAAYDYVFCLNVINHVANLRAALAALWRSLRAGGWLVLTVDAHNYRAFKHIFRLIPADILHPQQNDLAEYIALLRQLSPDAAIKTQILKREFFFSYQAIILQKPLPQDD